MFLPKEGGGLKVHVPSVLWYRSTFGTGGTCIFRSLSLYRNVLQKLNADKTSGELPTADIDLICVFQVIVALILFEKGAKTLLRKAAHGIIITTACKQRTGLWS